MLVVLGAHGIASLLAPYLFPRLGRNTFYVLATVPLLSFVWVLTQLAKNVEPTFLQNWIPQLSLDLAFRMDRLAIILALLVTGVGALVLVYCARYFNKNDKTGGFAAQLVAFSGVMFGLVTADNLILLFVFWEATSILSYLLIGYACQKLLARKAALQAMIVTTAGGLAMFVGLIILGETSNTYIISEILAQPVNNHKIDIAILLILLGIISKSALIPFHFWLPSAMAAPTPVSAYLHAAAMVKAGIYLVARLAGGFSETKFWFPIILTTGLLTMLVGGWKAIQQVDLKLLLAYGTVSQLGFLTIMVGFGTFNATIAGLSLLVGHALFKATLFLVTGIIDHQAGTRDIRKLSHIGKNAPLLATIGIIAAASMAGLPPLTGFIAKEAAYEVLNENNNNFLGFFLLVTVILASMFTFAYSTIFVKGAFGRKKNCEATKFASVPKLFILAPLVLTFGTIFFGLFPQFLENLVKPYAKNVYEYPEHSLHLALWHGFNEVLVLTLLTFLGGFLVFRYAKTLVLKQKKLISIPDAEHVYSRIMNGLDTVAIWVTGRTQRGSLPSYLTVILVVAMLAPTVSMLIWWRFPAQIYWYDNFLQLVVGIINVAAIVAAIKAKKRFTAILLVGISGYGMAFLFVIQGAPDLALTQVLVETVTLVSLILVLRILPQKLVNVGVSDFKFSRAVVAVAFGVFMSAVAFYVLPARIAEPISLDFPDLAYYLGGGKNIVNVTLVDIRAWDTMGEIAVLTVAATGVASLIFQRRKKALLDRSHNVASGSVGRVIDPSPGTKSAALKLLSQRFSVSKHSGWLLAGRTLAPEQRSIILEIVTRILFHSIIVVSLFFLFAGHNLPGGGFAAGLVVGVALTLRYLAGGRYELNEAIAFDAGILLGFGLFVSTLTALMPLFFGGNVLESFMLNFSFFPFGEVKFVSSIFFDIGVYLIVIGLILDVLRSLGSEIDRQMEITVNPTSGES